MKLKITTRGSTSRLDWRVEKKLNPRGWQVLAHGAGEREAGEKALDDAIKAAYPNKIVGGG